LPGEARQKGWVRVAASFAEWMREVDAAVWARAGLSVYDLEDVALADWYEDGVRAKTAAGRALRASGFRG
jgi:hypothetical protein